MKDLKFLLPGFLICALSPIAASVENPQIQLAIYAAGTALLITIYFILENPDRTLIYPIAAALLVSSITQIMHLEYYIIVISGTVLFLLYTIRFVKKKNKRPIDAWKLAGVLVLASGASLFLGGLSTVGIGLAVIYLFDRIVFTDQTYPRKAYLLHFIFLMISTFFIVYAQLQTNERMKTEVENKRLKAETNALKSSLKECEKSR